MFRRLRIRYIGPDDFLDVLERNATKKFILRAYDKQKGDFLQGRAYINDALVKISITLIDNGEPITYYTYKDDRDYIPTMAGMNAYTTLCKYWKVPKFEDLGYKISSYFSASPLIGYNPKYNKQRLPAWGYDLNSAYSYAMLREWIDTTDYRTGYIEEGEVGLTYNEEGKIVIERRIGKYAQFVFKKMETPEGIKRFIDKYYNMKKNATNREEKQKAKDMLNLCVGYLQRVNPFLRAWIVCQCNELIESLLDENSLFWNTDCIVSRVRRPDIEALLGVECGQWKLEHEGVVAYIENKYQWNDEVPVYRGVPKSAFPENYDILRDGVPKVNLIWEFDPDTISFEYKGE